MDMLSQMLTAPVEAHDALICTSKAVRDSVEVLLEGVHDFLAREYGGPRKRPQPQRVTIPLGVNVDDFQTSPEHRRAWRERLDIPADAVVALYVGRFNARDKMNPALMALALEMAAQQTGKTLYWVNSGWIEEHDDAERFHADTRQLCPSVEYRCVDGRAPDTRFSIWSVADFFISFSDNIQETFGLTPVEAMAAGLPCVVTDWDGYRDTVRHGEDGFRVPTVALAPGSGIDLAYWHARTWMSYPDYVGAASQATAVDFADATRAISILVLNAEFRRKLGRQAQAQARAVFDWAALIPQYQALWAELNARRHAAGPAAPQPDNPFRPDPFKLFAGYPTRHFGKAWTVELNRALTWPDIEQRLTLPLAAYSAFNRPSLEEIRRLVAWLAGRPSASVAEVVGLFPAMRQGPVERGLLWIARYGVVTLQPPA
jgi:glycosyltransferase involved in cell wall biosynthesis